MLNPQLYKALQRIFGDVKIANEDVSAAITTLPDSTNAWTIANGQEHGEQYLVNCPFCKDHKKHLYISYLSYAVPVINGYNLRIGSLRAKCFHSDCIGNKENYAQLSHKIGLALSMLGNGQAVGSTIDMDAAQEAPENIYNVSDNVSLSGLRTWIPDWQPIQKDTDPVIIEYLAKRGVTLDDIEWLKIGSGPIKSPRKQTYLNDGKSWVLFPIINNGKLAGVQARCPNVYMKEKGLKYWFHPGCRKKTVLMNLDYARSLGVGVITEGVFDVLSVGKPGVCCFGHTPSTAQQRLLRSFSRGLIWLPDTDVSPTLNAIEIARNFAAQWNAEGLFDLGVQVVILPKKDAGDLTRKEVWDVIIEQVTPAMKAYIQTNIFPHL